jgi:hypothetical protein
MNDYQTLHLEKRKTDGVRQREEVVARSKSPHLCYASNLARGYTSRNLPYEGHGGVAQF